MPTKWVWSSWNAFAVVHPATTQVAAAATICLSVVSLSILDTRVSKGRAMHKSSLAPPRALTPSRSGTSSSSSYTSSTETLSRHTTPRTLVEYHVTSTSVFRYLRSKRSRCLTIARRTVKFLLMDSLHHTKASRALSARLAGIGLCQEEADGVGMLMSSAKR